LAQLLGSKGNAVPDVISVGATGNQDIDGLLGGLRWATNTLSYSFPTSASFYDAGYGSGEPLNNFAAFNSAQQAAARLAFQNYSAVANLSFIEIAETSSQHGDLRLAESDTVSTAWAYDPSTSPIGGDSWYNNSSHAYDQPVKGNYAFTIFLHEIGHALGLKHGHETDTFGAMTAAHDSMEYSVMTYRSYVGASIDGGYANERWGFAQSLMMYDIAALQSMYGPNYATNSSDTEYSWSPTTGEQFVNGVGQGAAGANRIFMTVWDGGGIDTYNFSNYRTNLSVDLQPGAWSTLSAAQVVDLGYFDGAGQHFAAGNVANALLYGGDPRSLIENAIGGSGHDTIIGNSIANVLTGGAGNDKLYGLSGADTLIGGSGADSFFFDSTATSDAQLATANYDVILDYGQGTGSFSSVESDRIDLSALLSSAYNTGQPVDSLVVALDLGNATVLSVDVDGNAGGAQWLTVAQLNGLHFADPISVVLNPRLPLGTVITVQGGGGQVTELVKDFNADGYSDILWRNDTGLVSTWELRGSQIVGTPVFDTVPTTWHLEQPGDFNADGYSDLLWRHDDGRVATWHLMGDQVIATHVFDAVSTSWHIERTGDFSGDGHSDILWRNDSGLVSIWDLRDGNIAGTHVLASADSAWHIVASDDFNGDRSSDILWRHDDGRVATWHVKDGQIVGTQQVGALQNTSHIEDTIDFNADGHSDILWRDDDGDVFIWNLEAGQVTATQHLGGFEPTWHVEETGDFTGDGFGDILWRDDTGDVYASHIRSGNVVWTSDFGNVPTNWHIVTDHYDLF
jgi:serralysin